jgi:hypothetical protein
MWSSRRGWDAHADRGAAHQPRCSGAMLALVEVEAAAGAPRLVKA